MLMTGHIKAKKKKLRFVAMHEFFKDSPALALLCLLFITSGIVLVLGIAVQMYSNYQQNRVVAQATEKLQSLKTIDAMMVSTMDLPAKMTYLKQMAQLHDDQIFSENGEISLLMKVSPEQCQAFFNQLPNYIGYVGYSLVTNNVNQGFNPDEPIAQDMRNVMCSQSSNTIVRRYFIVNDNVVDFTYLSKSMSANDDNRPTPVTDNSPALTQVNNNEVDNDGATTVTSQQIVIDNGNVHVVINNSTGYVQQDDSDSDDDNSDDSNTQSQTPCDLRNN
jgi:hypothetical protein